MCSQITIESLQVYSPLKITRRKRDTKIWDKITASQCYECVKNVENKSNHYMRSIYFIPKGSSVSAGFQNCCVNQAKWLLYFLLISLLDKESYLQDFDFNAFVIFLQFLQTCRATCRLWCNCKYVELYCKINADKSINFLKLWKDSI